MIRRLKAAITIIVRNNVKAIDTTRFILLFTKKFTRGWSTIAMIIAKTIGIMIALATYNIASKATKPIKKRLALAKNGNCISFVITDYVFYFFFRKKY
jgi:hypothetical protein